MHLIFVLKNGCDIVPCVSPAIVHFLTSALPTSHRTHVLISDSYPSPIKSILPACVYLAPAHSIASVPASFSGSMPVSSPPCACCVDQHWGASGDVKLGQDAAGPPLRPGSSIVAAFFLAVCGPPSSHRHRPRIRLGTQHRCQEPAPPKVAAGVV
jgi:hypothetical protein